MYKFSQLLITPVENETHTTHIYVAEPTPLEEKNFGSIFSIINIESKDEANSEVINLINEEITQNYYRSTDLEIETAFENTLNLLNRKLQKAMAELGEEWIKKLNICIGVIKDKELHFSQTGNINILLAQKNQIVKLSDNVKYQTKNPLKILANISSGQLILHSAIIFCTESILDYISQEKIRKTIRENNPTDAARMLEDILQENGNTTNFAAILIKLLPETSPANVEQPIAEKLEHTNLNGPETVSEDSMTKLKHQESKTTELLSPSLWPGLKKNLKQFSEKIKPIKINKTESEDDLNLKNPSSPVIIFLKKILLIIKNLSLRALSGLMVLLRKFIGLFKQPRKYSSTFNTLPNKAGGVVAKSVNWFKQLSTPRKAFIVLFIVILFVFSQSIIRQGEKQDSYKEETQYATSLTTATNKIGEAETKILMSDYASARILIKDATDQLNSIPKNTDTWKKNGDAALAKIQTISDQVNYIQRINEPKSVANYSSLGNNIAPNKLSLISKTAFAFDANKNSVYSYNLDKNEAKVSINQDEENKKFIAITKDSAATILTVLSNQNIVQFNPVLEKLSKITIDFNNQDTNIVDLDYFASKLYTLDIKNNQIFKNAKSGDNYGSSEEWINDSNVDIKDAKSFAIDGSVYILKDKGVVIKLFGGKLVADWALETSTPGLDGATKLFTDDTTDNIYILNPAQKLVAVFDKEGKLKNQYLSDKWSNLKDLYVDEANKKLYVLNGTEVFEVELP